MKFLYHFLTVSLFVFQGCSTEQATPQLNNSHAKIADTTSNTSQNLATETREAAAQKTDSQIEDFEEEFSEKETVEAADPLSAYNRSMTSFNDAFITYALNPISEAYGDVIPQPFRLGISNFIHNIQFPIRLANNLLQLKFQNSSDELESFLVNSTIGLGGLMDPAKNYMHIPTHDEDFGQTLGHYGAGSGFHIVLPFLGPSNIRDLVGIGLDAYASPLVHVRGLDNYKIPNNLAQSLGIVAGALINKNSLNPGTYESLKKDAVDLYPFLKDIYEQKRNSDIAE